jgi:uncharacterized 2Fe-2S/4Fe-4S cluster protein (DUF4445 family)
MVKIVFEPSGKIVEIPPGTELLAALAQAGIEIATPCGGEGICGQCQIQVISGRVDSDSLGILSEAEVHSGCFLACRTRVMDTFLRIKIPEPVKQREGQFVDETDKTCRIHQRLVPKNQAPDPKVIKDKLTVPPPQLEDGLSDLDRLTRTIQANWGNKEVQYPLPVIRQLADVLREAEGVVTVSLVEQQFSLSIIAVEPGDCLLENFGIAVDIGTTTVAVQLVKMSNGTILATGTDYNEQINCGLDVINRINYARKPERLEELRVKVQRTINGLINRICQKQKLLPEKISQAVLAGNTTMIHFLLSLKPEYIRLEPYTPTLLKALWLTAGEVGVGINPSAPVYISPGVGSYVGGDITAGLLCTDLAADSDGLMLFIDIGTNGELVIGNRDFLMACACSAGPAFEGSGIKSGMRASIGAIEKVDVDVDTGVASYQTVGNVRPQGICGSGMISLLASLFVSGWVDAAGKLNRTKKSAAIRIEGRKATYIVVPAKESAAGEPIILDEIDIENIIRAKAAVYSACSLLLKQVGFTIDDLAKVYIAGGFGRFLDIDKAIIIGLVPDLPRERYLYLGNSSLMGAYLALISSQYRQRQIELAGRVTIVELSTTPDYMDQYTGALFLPHTDINLFPTVRKVIK